MCTKAESKRLCIITGEGDVPAFKGCGPKLELWDGIRGNGRELSDSAILPIIG
jgi:hypothetical protein